VLTIVLVPSAAMLILGVGAAGYLIHQGSSAKNWAANVELGTSAGMQFTEQVQEERRLSLLKLGGDTQDTAGLAQQRRAVDSAVVGLNAVGDLLRQLDPAAISGANNTFNQAFAKLPGTRQAIDQGTISLADVYTYYNQMVSVVVVGLQDIAQTAPDPVTAIQEITASNLFQAIDSMSRSNALAAGGVSGGGLTEAELEQYRTDVGDYHEQLSQLAVQLPTGEAGQYRTLVNSAAWQQLTTMENAVLNRGAKPVGHNDERPLPLSIADWQANAVKVTNSLLSIWSEQHNYSEELAKTNGQNTFVNSLWAGGLVLLIAIVAFLIALRLCNLLVNRLKRLRAETLDLADVRLPMIVARLHAGKQAEEDTDLPLREHGADEIGEVADAFNKAHRAAVRAATQEARTREGMNAVFLNIAHRSQIVVHRQLAVLDEAERVQEDPTHLELLFQLDHLATRARRNAENLVILGGERPGRKWRKPVPLEEIARSAVSETENFARVRTVRLPEVAIAGDAVADLMHLLAELVDNATTFSPPDSRVQVRGNLVGKGVAVEVEDQGLGITREERDRLNVILRDPPDFEAMGWAKTMRLGLFVVAQLAARHGIVVTLAESAFGGVHAIVLIPTELITAEGEAEDPGRPAVSARQARQLGGRRRAMASTATHRREPEPEHFAGTAVDQSTVRWPQDEPPPETPASREPAVSTDSYRSGMPVARGGPATHAQPGTGRRTALPRRQRQTNIAPELMADLVTAEDAADGPEPVRSPERARNTMSALLRGTEQGRSTPPRSEL
jgi:signal transduction histidine kinase